MSGPNRRRDRKIIFVNRYYFPDESATSQILTDLSTRIAIVGYEVVVVTSRLMHGGTARVLPRRESIGGVSVRRIWTTSFGRGGHGRALDYLSFYAMSALQILRLARRGDIVVAKTDPPMLSIFLLLPVKVRGGRLVNWLQDMFPEVVEVLSPRALPRFLVRALAGLRNVSLRFSDANVAIGHAMESSLVAKGIPARSITVIPNWADGAAIVPMPARANSLRHEWGLDNAFVAAYSGNLGRAHELEVIMQAARLTRDNDRLVYLFIGSGFQRKQLETMKDRWKLDNVVFKDPVPRASLGLSLTMPDLHIVSLKPALEGYIVPSKVYGILAAGIPTVFIGDENGEVGRLLRGPPAAGVAVPADDAAALARTLLHLAASPGVCAQMSEAARNAFVTDYDVAVTTSAWQRLLQQVSMPD